MRCEILGGLRVLHGGSPAQLGGPLAQRLLAALLVDAPRVVERETLTERLWGTCAPATARTALQVHVSNLRRALEPGRRGGAGSVVRTTGEGYALKIDRPRTDGDRFESLTRDAEDLLVRCGEAARGARSQTRSGCVRMRRDSRS